MDQNNYYLAANILGFGSIVLHKIYATTKRSP
jgi:hypothetical protein